MFQTTESTPLAVVQFKWKLTNIPTGNTTALSNMIPFLGEKAFRVGIKPYPFSVGRLTLLFMALNLNKIGITVFKVLFSNGVYGNLKPMNLGARNGDVNGCLQLFTASFEISQPPVLNYPRYHEYEIHFNGIAENYKFQERDCLLKSQMWSSVMNQVGTDFEFVATGRSFPAYK